jgi:glucose/arabinose dehydrogenase
MSLAARRTLQGCVVCMQRSYATSQARGLACMLLTGLAAFVFAACYGLRPSNGGAQIDRDDARRSTYQPRDIAVPTGYRVRLVASGLDMPTGVCFDGDGRPCVLEAGYSYGEVWRTPRLLRLGEGEQPDVLAEGGRNGPWNGVDFADGSFYVAEGGVLEGGRILRIEPDGTQRVLVSGLPSFGDHHTNGPAVRDGWVYFGQGTATNSGVVGEDNAEFGWLARHPDFHDLPGQAIELNGNAFASADVLRKRGHAKTGAFAAFGQTPPRAVEASLPCTGSVLRVPVDGGALELVAWGFRNPFGLAFAPDGTLYATDNGYDDRGSRPVWGAPDLMWRVEANRWYGWPDYSGNRALTEEEFQPPGKDPLKFLLREHPGEPPAPTALFEVHCSADGFDFSRSEAFGHVGQAFVAMFGDQAPTTGKLLGPAGFKVVRVDPASGACEDFAVARGDQSGPASLVGGHGLERPIAARFNREGTALYVVDFGVLRQDEDGAHPVERTGALWKIERIIGEAR